MNNIPPEANISSNASMSSYIPSKLYYFGNCKDTVDIDGMWDANEMSQVLMSSDLLPTSSTVKAIQDGDRNIPSDLKSWTNKNQDKLDDVSEIVCGINTYQHIAFIYVSELDTHFFFDV